MKKAWKIGISTIAGIVGACVLIRIHNAEVRKVYCERYGKGYDEGYTLGLYQGKLMGANDLYMNAHNSINKRTESWRNLRLLFFMKGIRNMLQKIIAFVINFLTLSSPCGWMMDILKDTRKYKFYNPLRELEIAENHFNFCEQEHMSAAIFELCVAESRVKTLMGGAAL